MHGTSALVALASNTCEKDSGNKEWTQAGTDAASLSLPVRDEAQGKNFFLRGRACVVWRSTRARQRNPLTKGYS